MKTITIATVADRLNCNLSVARRAIHKLLSENKIKPLVMHSKFYLCTRFPQKEGEKPAEEKPAKPVKGAKNPKAASQ